MSGIVVASILFAMLAVAAVFVEIPVVSNYCFWVMGFAWLLSIARNK